jgi:uncharacterized protein YkwD
MRSLLRTSITIAFLVALAAGPAAAPAATARNHHRARLTRVYLPPAHLPARLDAPCPGAEVNAQDTTPVAFAGAVMCLVNQERAEAGLGALVARPLLGAVGLRHADLMVVQDFFGHAEPGGLSFRRRISAAGYYRRPAVGFLAGENIAWSAGDSATPRTMVTEWMHSPAHRVQILDRRYREAGIGVVMASPPSLNATGLPGVTAAMEFGALTYSSARLARNLKV